MFIKIPENPSLLRLSTMVTTVEKLRLKLLRAVKGKIDFPQIGFEKGTTERGFQR